MKYEVKRFFKLKPSNKRYRAGSVFETNNEELAEQLRDDGFLGKRIPEPPAAAAPLPVEEETPLPEEDEEQEDQEQTEAVDLGGGWYQLSDGRKVRKSQLESEM